MGIKVRCPNPACAKKMTVGTAYAGKRLHCPVCGTEFVAASSDQAAPKQSPALWAPLLGEFVAGPSSEGKLPEETRSESGAAKELSPLSKAWEALDVEELLAKEAKSRGVQDREAAGKKNASIRPPSSTSEPPATAPKQPVSGTANAAQKSLRFWAIAIGAAAVCLGLLVGGVLVLSRPDPGQAMGQGNEQPPTAKRQPAPPLAPRKDSDQNQSAAPLATGTLVFQRASPAVVRLDVWDSELDRISTGSAFCVSDECALVTNAHVIREADLILAHNERIAFFITAVSAVDSQADLAVLKAPAGSLPKLEMADRNPPSVGTDVYAIGSPLGLTNVFSQGIISAYHQRGDIGLIQMTAQISSGSSGGPVLGSDGKVLAVTTAYLAGGQNLNFAVPADRVRILLDRPGKVRVLRTDARRKGESDLTLLHHAAVEGAAPLVEMLVRRDADVNARDSNGDTPLHLAVMGRRLEAVKRLVSDRTDVNASNNDGSTPLHLAAKYASSDIAKFLIQKGADANVSENTGWTPLHFAAQYGSSDIALVLIQNRGNVLAKEKSFSMTPFHTAACAGNKDVGQVILEAVKDVNLRDDAGRTPLHWAALANRRGFAEWLIEKGADINAKSKSGHTPVRLAAEYDHRELENRLRELGGRE